MPIIFLPSTPNPPTLHFLVNKLGVGALTVVYPEVRPWMVVTECYLYKTKSKLRVLARNLLPNVAQVQQSLDTGIYHTSNSR